MRPILLNSCARAATAAEAAFRIDAVIDGRRASRVVALDPPAWAIVGGASEIGWHGARFFHSDSTAADETADALTIDLTLRDAGGLSVSVNQIVDDADLVVIVATESRAGAAAAVIGTACSLRGVMTAGLILGQSDRVNDVVSALRPYARVLLVSSDEADVVDMLTALRA